MRNRIFFILLGFILLSQVFAAHAGDNVLICKGQWGQEVNQLGIKLPSPGVLPIAPYQCIGGFDIDHEGAAWFSDSVNSRLKCFKKNEWSYIMLNFGRLGDLVCLKQRLYVLTREPDGVAVINPANGKIERHVKIAFKNPGRLSVISDKLFLIEDQGNGLLICKNDQTVQHPAVALEPACDGQRLFGVQYNLEADSRGIIAAELADELQEPEMIGLYEPGEPIVFIKTAGIHANRLVVQVVTRSNPEILNFAKLGEHAEVLQSVALPVFDAPFLTASWKLCSDGKLYGFSGSATDGFTLLRSGNNF